MSQIAIYAGWYAENVSGPFELPKVEFMPGAFAYHLHSFSAYTIRSTDHDWVGPFLAKGTTCTMGCVNEPYLTFTPNVAMFVMRFTVGQLTFGEAAWASQPVLSWQITVVGDPLYRPFAKSPQALHEELTQRHSPFLEWSYLRVVNLEALRGARPLQLAQYLENLPDISTSAVLTEKLAGYYEQQGKPSSAIATLQLALKRNPTPQQRIRIRLTLGEKLLAQDSTASALDDYRKLVEESPDYPGRSAIDEKIKSLDERLHGTNALAK
jgi:regulator of sirC expression with transglutaminase-like and TPR domain